MRARAASVARRRRRPLRRARSSVRVSRIGGCVEERHAGLDGAQFLGQLRAWARELGFSQIGVADVDLRDAEPGLRDWLAAGFHGGMRYMARHGMRRARPAELVPGTVRVITARMDYLPRATPRAGRPRVAAPRATPAARRCRSTRAAATITRCCASGCSSSPIGWPQRSAPSATACSPTRRRCSKWNSPRAAASAGAANTRWRCRARPARCSSSARSTSTCALPLTAADRGALRQLQRLHRRVPDAGHRRAVPARCQALHLLSDDRARRADPGRAAAADRQPHLRLRRLPARLPVEQVRAARDAARLRCARAAGRADAAELWAWSEAEFLHHTEGSAIRRIGFARWRRNLAVALGNALRAGGDPTIEQALRGTAR